VKVDQRGPIIVVLTGVSGSGKTVIGDLLAKRLGWPFEDGDDYHPTTNITKMTSGKALSDEDREPWLANLRDLMQDRLAKGESSVVACSALKKSYRKILTGSDNRIYLIHLAGNFDLIYRRMSSREGHYMKERMLRSQFATLEPPTDAIEVSIDTNPEAIVGSIICALSQR
jgi:carbohydrate kinase (thermoresistant glucokinase family)